MMQEANGTDPDDATLVRQVREGDRDAFTQLLLRHRPSLVRLCRRLPGESWEADDVAQEASLQALLGIDRLVEPASFGPWLHAIAANLAAHISLLWEF